jgi:uncharacterized protein
MPVRVGWIVAGGAALGIAAVVAVGLLDDDPKVAQAGVRLEAQGAQEGQVVQTVTVTGTGRANGTPDTATLFMGARAERSTAQEAMAVVNENANALLDVLTGAGVEEKDIQTTSVSLYPTYGPNGGQITGYAAENSVSVKLRDLANAGAVIDAASAAVGDELTLGGISFAIEDPEPLRVQARASAVEQARARAEQLAELAGGALGDVVQISDGSMQVTPPVTYAVAERAAADMAAPIQAGSQEVTADVTVTFELTS